MRIAPWNGLNLAVLFLMFSKITLPYDMETEGGGMAPVLIDRTSAEALPDDLAALLPAEVPALVAVGWITEHLGITPQSVNAAIRAGRIPSLDIPSVGGTVAVRAVSPIDAVRLWGSRVIRRRERDAAAQKVTRP